MTRFLAAAGTTISWVESATTHWPAMAATTHSPVPLAMTSFSAGRDSADTINGGKGTDLAAQDFADTYHDVETLV